MGDYNKTTYSRITGTANNAELSVRDLLGHGIVIRKEGIRVERGKIIDIGDVVVDFTDPTGIEGKVVDKEGNPIADAEIAVLGKGEEARTYTDKNAYYFLSGIAEGNQWVRAYLADHQTEKKEDIIVIKGKKTEVNFVFNKPTILGRPNSIDPDIVGCGDKEKSIRDAFGLAIKNPSRCLSGDAMKQFNEAVPKVKKITCNYTKACAAANEQESRIQLNLNTVFDVSLCGSLEKHSFMR